MSRILCRWIWTLAAVVAGCRDSEEELQIVGPDLPQGPARAYPITAVSFPSNDGVEVSATVWHGPRWRIVAGSDPPARSGREQIRLVEQYRHVLGLARARLRGLGHRHARAWPNPAAR